MPRKPSPTSPSNIILSHLLDVGGVIESRNVNGTLQDATGLSSKQIGNALPRMEKQGLIARRSGGSGSRTTSVTLIDHATSTMLAKPKKQRDRPPKSVATKKTPPPAPLDSPVPLYLGEQVTVVGLYLAGDTVGLALARADDLIVNLTVIIPKD